MTRFTVVVREVRTTERAKEFDAKDMQAALVQAQNEFWTDESWRAIDSYVNACELRSIEVSAVQPNAEGDK